MTTVHLVRGLYIAVSVLVAMVALWRTARAPLARDRFAGCALAGYAIATAASQVYAFDLPLTLGTAFVGYGIVSAVCWLTALAVVRLTHRRGS